VLLGVKFDQKDSPKKGTLIYLPQEKKSIGGIKVKVLGHEDPKFKNQEKLNSKF